MTFPRTTLMLATALLTVSAVSAPGQSQLTAAPDAIEEDWVLVVASPDPIGVGPQITTVMSPTGNPTDPFVAFDLDYREYPIFAPGGMQVQVWSSKNVLSTSTQGSALFNTPNETVSWTQRMSLSGGTLTYDIANGQSTTWGQFGQGTQLQVSYNTPVTSLAGYDPGFSATKSGASWEPNYVKTLTLKQVRYYANGQLIWTNTNPKVLIDNSDSD
jgi:hypothetical protein